MYKGAIFGAKTSDTFLASLAILRIFARSHRNKPFGHFGVFRGSVRDVQLASISLPTSSPNKRISTKFFATKHPITTCFMRVFRVHPNNVGKSNTAKVEEGVHDYLVASSTSGQR